MIRFLTVLATIVAVAATAPPAERRFDVGRFDAIDLAGSDDVRVVRGDRIAVVASGDPRAVAALTIAVRGTTLRVTRRPGNWNDRGATVTVTIPTLRAATITGSGDLTADRIDTPAFAGRVGGSGTLRVRGLRTADARIDLGGSGDIVIDGTVTGAMSITLSGTGDVDARGVMTPQVQVALTGTGDVTAHATRTARIAASGTGDVIVTGHPRCDVRKSGLSDVTCD